MLVIHQTNLDGHRAEYVEHILNWANQRGMESMIWIESAKLEDLRSRFPPTSLSQLRRVGQISRKVLYELNLDPAKTKIVFLDGDNALQFASNNFLRFRGYKSYFLLLRANRPVGALQIVPWIKFLAKISLAAVFSASPVLSVKKLVFLNRRSQEFLRGVRDPLYTKSAPASTTVIKNRQHLVKVGVVGTLDPRKSIDLAIKAVEKLGDGFQLHLVGKVSKDFEVELKNLTKDKSFVHLRPGLLSEQELDARILELDCFLVLQQTNAPSGTLLKALSFGVPVVLGGAKVLKPAAKKYLGNVTWTRLHWEDVARSIQQAVSKKATPISDLPNAQHFAEDLLGS